MSRLRGAETVIVGIPPGSGFCIVQLGLNTGGGVVGVGGVGLGGGVGGGGGGGGEKKKQKKKKNTQKKKTKTKKKKKKKNQKKALRKRLTWRKVWPT